MGNFKQYEKDESSNLAKLVEAMNHLHAIMGGRDNRPERRALNSCMRILRKEFERSKNERLSHADK